MAAPPTVLNHYYDGRTLPDRCVVKMRSPDTIEYCIVVFQYYTAPNSNESLLRCPHVAGSLCSENAPSRCMIFHTRKSILRGSQKCQDALRHQNVHERYVCVLRIVNFLIDCKFQKIVMLVPRFLCSENAFTGHDGILHSRISILHRPQQQ